MLRKTSENDRIRTYSAFPDNATGAASMTQPDRLGSVDEIKLSTLDIVWVN